MYKTLLRFLKYDLGPRCRDVFLGSEIFLSLLIATCLCVLAEKSFWIPTVGAHTLMTAILTYASIAFGFSITGASVSLALPADFVRLLHENKDRWGNSMFENLIFLFTWTGVVHVFVVILSTVAFFLYRDTDSFFNLGGSWKNYYASVILGLSVYGIIQFMITIAVINGVGRVYTKSLIQGSKNPDGTDQAD